MVREQIMDMIILGKYILGNYILGKPISNGHEYFGKLYQAIVIWMQHVGFSKDRGFH